MKKKEKLLEASNKEKATQKSELLKTEEFQSFINKMNEKYYYWDKVKYHKSSLKSNPKLLWDAVKQNRNLNAKHIKFGKHDFKYNITESIQKSLQKFDINISENTLVTSKISETDKNDYLLSALMEEAIASSQFEGAVTARVHAKELLRKVENPVSKSDEMIINNFLALQYIHKIQNENITVKKLLELNRLLTNQLQYKTKDQNLFRTKNDFSVNDEKLPYTPPNSSEIPELMKEFCSFFNEKSNSNKVHPLIIANIIHFIIGYIHPFAHGNGRIARILFYWYLLKNGYWITEYISISRLMLKSKKQYYQAFIFTEKDENDMTYFLRYMLKTIHHALNSLDAYVQRKISSKKLLTQIRQIKGINPSQAAVLKLMIDEPGLLFSLDEISSKLEFTSNISETVLEGLVKKGYLKMIIMKDQTKAFFQSDQFAEILKKEMNH